MTPDQEQLIIERRVLGESARTISATVGIHHSNVARFLAKPDNAKTVSRLLAKAADAERRKLITRPKRRANRKPQPTPQGHAPQSGPTGRSRILPFISIGQPGAVLNGWTAASPIVHGRGCLDTHETYESWLDRRDADKLLPDDPGPASVTTPSGTYSFDVLNVPDIARCASIVAADLGTEDENRIRELLSRVEPGGRVVIE